MTAFQSLGIVWEKNTQEGLMFLETEVRKIRKQPEFSFKYDSLYAEPTNSHKVLGETSVVLTQQEINEILEFLETESTKPPVVNGVNAEGKYLEGVSVDEIVRPVQYVPDTKNSWRFNFELARDNVGDHWMQGSRVDKDGTNLGFGEELPEHTVVTEPLPDAEYGEIWKWDFKKNKWVDARPRAEILDYLREYKKYEALMHYNHVLETSSVSVLGFEFGLDLLTRTGIAEMLATKFSGTKQWTPKGHTAQLQFLYDDFLQILESITEKKNSLFNVYLQHKINITENTSIKGLKSYDVTTGYGNTEKNT